MTGAPATGSPVIRGRERETATVAALLTSARSGNGGALVIQGEAGIGKSAVLEHALARCTDVRALRAAGAEFEMELPYAALHQLCAPVLDRRRELPEPQRIALEAVFGLDEHRAPDRFLVGLAVLGLLAEVGHDEPVMCVIDDAQWVDAASLEAFVFAARRVEAERVALLFAVRDPDATPQLAGLPRLPVGRLGDADARALLATAVGVPLDDDVRDRVVAEAHGNPLALLELPRSVNATELAGGFGGLQARPVGGVIEANVTRRVAELAPEARTMLVLAAAEPLGDPALLRRAAGHLGVNLATAEDLEASGLLSLGARVRFRHPLVRSASYRTAMPSERRRVHAALADATDGDDDPDRRAWHRAQATVEPDEDVAAELVRSADRAQVRGGLAAASAFLERAAELTPDAGTRAGRTLAAAQTRLQSGAPHAALDLLVRAEAGPLSDPERGQARLLRALTDFHRTRGAEATASLLEAAGGLEPDLARETYVLAFSSAMFIDRLPGRVQALAEQVRARAPERAPPRPVDRFLDALTDEMTLASGAEAVPAMRRAVAAFYDDSSGDSRWLDLVCLMAVDLHDDGALHVLADRQVHLARRQGDLAVLPDALNMQAIARVLDGRFTDGAAAVAEVRAVQAATGAFGMIYGDVILAAWRGNERHVDAVFERVHEGWAAAT